MNEPVPPADPAHSFIVVGLGASAGGLGALKEFFRLMRADSGMAFVVVVHLSPDHESNLASILQKSTAMPVHQVTEATRIEPDAVYVIPPRNLLTLVDGTIAPAPMITQGGSRIVIDRFFRTLAEAYEERAVAIVLSGTGSDGTLGLKQVKERNGFTIVQKPSDAEYDDMPRSAIATGLVDWVLPVDQMPGQLLKYRESSERLQLTVRAADGPPGLAGLELLDDLLTLVRIRTGNDFSAYRRPTILRRVARHLQIHQIESIGAYLAFLQDRPDDMELLVRNLLINVTNFFRDGEAFAALEGGVIPRLFAGKAAMDTVRVWVPGCASGEEAYSVAILLQEHAGHLADPPKIQVFATDVDDEALAEARHNCFPESIEGDVSADRLGQFFVREKEYYRVKKSLRELVLFAPHNLLRDPPFSRLDLIACRNVLIYLNRSAQSQALQTFHFALAPGGFLFLGTSESADYAQALFESLDKKWRLYRRRQSSAQYGKVPAVSLAAAPLPKISENLGHDDRTPVVSVRDLHYRLIEQYASPSILLNDAFEILHISSGAGRYLQYPGGEPSTNILKAIHPDLLPEIRTCLYASRDGDGGPRPSRIMAWGGDHTVTMLTRRIEGVASTGPLWLISFEEHPAPADGVSPFSSELATGADDAVHAVIRRLEQQLTLTREQLHSTIHQHEASLADLKASNEELQAVNEELRSASEELETSKEELQSVNEELATANTDLKDKLAEISDANADLQNFMSATDIGTVFLDSGLHIKRYTPSAEKSSTSFLPTPVALSRTSPTGSHPSTWCSSRARSWKASQL